MFSRLRLLCPALSIPLWPPSTALVPLQLLHSSAPLSAAPGKKKKSKADPMLTKSREEKRQKRLQKALKKMEKKSRLPKPFKEMEVTMEMRSTLEQRKRNVVVAGEEVQEKRALLMKDWSRFSGVRHRDEIYSMDCIITAQLKAVQELQFVSRELYLAAIQPDPAMISYKTVGPTRTPPIADYLQDGEYKETTKHFEVQYADMAEYLARLTKKRKKKKKVVEEDDDDD